LSFYVRLGRWDLRLEGFPDHQTRRVAELFPGRVATTPRAGLPLLTCSLVDEPGTCARRDETLRFEGPPIKVAREVFVRYAREGSKLWGRVSQTALFCLDESHPMESRVWLDDRRPAPVPGRPREIREPEPEAFLYPLLVEWLRAHDACFVHCGAVVLGDRTVMLTGPTGSGKSTHVLRMLLRGASFLADDLAILSREADGVWAYPFREVANVNQGSMRRFPELAFLDRAPLRGDGKYCVDVGQFFDQKAVGKAAPGVVLHLHPDPEPWIRPRARRDQLGGLGDMAWYPSSPARNEPHFWLLVDWLLAGEHHDVSQGYMAENLGQLLDALGARREGTDGAS